ncbi:long chain acyl-CoA synthetase 4-like protein [Corchorus olitorius]|uniref:Long chain acyl-CoA synthetase 4-like protein n=1 Tax=Corchorus olitorius TaxID=93759 RepID=A0A1R3K769_9ROSI|nr:long chain acyl-CoA synthetase 4-like protein [Corchorus olitorius]
MAAKPLTTEAIALTEKKMDMTLDDIIKMSKNSSHKNKKQPRASNKSHKPVNHSVKEKALKVRQYMNSRSTVRQGVLAQRRSNFQGNRFPLAADAARRAAAAPLRVRAFNGGRVANMMNKPSLENSHLFSPVLLLHGGLSLWFCDSKAFPILPTMVRFPSPKVLVLDAGHVGIGAPPVQRRAANGSFSLKIGGTLVDSLIVFYELLAALVDVRTMLCKEMVVEGKEGLGEEADMATDAGETYSPYSVGTRCGASLSCCFCLSVDAKLIELDTSLLSFTINMLFKGFYARM